MSDMRIINQEIDENDRWNEKIARGMDIAVKKEIAELRRLKLPVIVSRNGKPFDIKPDTTSEAPPWKD